VTEGLDVHRARVDVAAALRRVRWTQVLAVGATAVAFAGLTIATAFTAVDLHLPPDGAHYIADADSLLGQGARELRHPPGFPALVALVRPFAGRVDSFAWAMAVAMALLPVALHVLARRWFTFGPSLIGATTGSLMPVIGELYAWGGGATLLGTVMLVFAIAAMETWIERGGRIGFLVGACLAGIALSHALPLAMAAVILGVRWLVHLGARRRLSGGWDPLGWRGIASVAAVAVPVSLLVLPLHQGPGVSVGIPRATTSWSLLLWALGDHRIFWLIGILAIVGLQLSDRRGAVVVGATCLAIMIVFPALLEGDVTYANRAEYLGPIVLSLGIAGGAQALRDRTARRLPQLGRPVLAVVVALGIVAATAYLPKVVAAVPFYNAWLVRADVRLLASMSGEQGGVAASWRSNVYTDGIQLAWYIEGLAARPAYGSAHAALSNIESQFTSGLDMQRLFAGTDGLENGAIQVSAAPVGSSNDLGIQVASEGSHHPFLSLDTVQPKEGTRAKTSRSRVDGNVLISEFEDGDGGEAFIRHAVVDGHSVRVDLEASASDPGGSWGMDLVAAGDVPTMELTQSDDRVRGTVNIDGRVQRFSVTAVSGTELEISADVPAAIRVRSEDRDVAFVIRVSTEPDPGRIVAFDQGTILDRYDITDILVMKDTGLLPRFDADPCYERSRHSRNLMLYAVRAAGCRGTSNP
jgi:hypothetical protein